MILMIDPNAALRFLLWFSNEFLSQIPLEAIATRPAGIQDY
jgi:hypothetical protein